MEEFRENFFVCTIYIGVNEKSERHQAYERRINQYCAMCCTLIDQAITDHPLSLCLLQLQLKSGLDILLRRKKQSCLIDSIGIILFDKLLKEYMDILRRIPLSSLMKYQVLDCFGLHYFVYSQVIYKVRVQESIKKDILLHFCLLLVFFPSIG